MRGAYAVVIGNKTEDGVGAAQIYADYETFLVHGY